MSATDEELDAVHDTGMDHVTYVLGMYRCVVFRSLSRLAVCLLLLLKSGLLGVPLYAFPRQPLRDLGEECRHVGARRLFCASGW
jgi:hypothetical protein